MADRKPPPNLIDLLAGLEDIRIPEPVSYMPQTIGWVVLAGLIVTVCSLALWALQRHRAANAYRRQALRALDQLERASAEVRVTRTAAILRGTALVAFPRGEVASLTGEDWSDFLNKTGRAVFERDGDHVLLMSVYSEKPDIASRDAELFVSNAKLWITSHRAGAFTGSANV